MSTEYNKRFNIPPVYAVTSGKGGVGKTVISLGMAKVLAARGKRVLLIDADSGLGNLHIMTNSTPVFTIEDLMAGDCSLDEALIRPAKNLDLIPAASGISDDNFPPQFDTINLRLKFAGLNNRYDMIIIDTPSGLSPNIKSIAAFAERLILVVTPELSSLADSYAVLKVLNGKKLCNDCGIIVNMSQSRYEGEMTLEKFGDMTERFIGLELKHSLWLPFDPQVKAILMRQNMLALEGGFCLFFEYLEKAIESICPASPAQNMNTGNETEGTLNSDFSLSSGTFSSDRKTEIPRAGELEELTANPKSQVQGKISYES